ncbi:endoribonuclease YbeY-like [Babylonia areolata]|uniref:endoribonuclease YbeY-like n=1 Tax=Babylonia areolata TaxID=304850 RepID=UPI003FD4CBB9
MTLVLKNFQNIVKLRMPQIERDILTLRRLMTIDKYDVSVLFVSDQHIQSLNQDYRQVEGPTDVLAFPVLEIAEPGIIPTPNENMDMAEEMPLGDILLAPAYISHQCQRLHENFDHVLITTVTHGLCHLIGHDHETAEQQRCMRGAESSILDRFNKLTGYSCKPLTIIGH